MLQSAEPKATVCFTLGAKEAIKSSACNLLLGELDLLCHLVLERLGDLHLAVLCNSIFQLAVDLHLLSKGTNRM